MEIRNLLVILAGAAALRGEPATSSPIKSYPLDERTVYAIAISQDEPTTCVFPEKLTALESANVSLKPDERPAVLMSYQPGAPFFSVRALRPDAHAAVNVLLRGKVFVLNFATAVAPDRAVIFFDAPLGSPARAPREATPEILKSLIERAKNFARLREQYPALTQAIDHATPSTVSPGQGFTVKVDEVFRFDAEDVLVFRVRFANAGDSIVRYDSRRLAVRAGHTVYPVALADASGVISPRGDTEAFLAVAGAPEGGRANLSVKNVFSILVPRAK
ncbi:MAG: hypothetical protein EXS38_07925 [Opitutus sp.]|nr:hypothetical protein [Opitutus sp.]